MKESASQIGRSVTCIVMCLTLLSGAAPLLSHPDPGLDSLRLAVLTWGNALVSGDAEAMAAVLHETFTADGGIGREGYLERAGRASIRFDGFFLRYAEHTIDGETARVAPVVVRASGGLTRAYELKLLQEDDDWMISAVAALPDVPEEFRPVLPEHQELRSVPVRLVDEVTDELVGARVRITDTGGTYWPPEGHMRHVATGWREDVGRDVHVDGKTWAYVSGSFSVPLPNGRFLIEVRRGLEYEPAQLEIEVDANGAPKPAEVRLERWVHLAEEGWYSGDTHVHFVDPMSAMAELEGEDLNVLNILATRWGDVVTNVEHFTGAPSQLSRRNRLVYVGEETRHGFLGHTVLLGLDELVYPLTWGGPAEGVAGGYDYPPMAVQADKAHAQGGHVSWAHFPGPIGEVAIDIALGKIDSIDLLTWGDAFSGGANGTAGLWYRFLNCGFDLPAAGGTDKMLNTQVSGSVRTYVRVDDAPNGLDYDRWLAGLRAGRTFVTTGPIVELEVDGQGIGGRLSLPAGATVKAKARVRSRLPVEYVEIVQDGRVVGRVENPEGREELEVEVEVRASESSWVAARAYSSEQLPYQAWDFLGTTGIPVMAHTSPIYLEVGGQPRRSSVDAKFFIAWCDRAIGWAQNSARFHTEVQREEVIALFRSARAVYEAQLES